MFTVRPSLIAATILLSSTAALATHPVIPVNLTQLNLDMSPLAAGAQATGLGVIIVVYSDAATCDSTAKYAAEFEIVPFGNNFTGTPTNTIKWDDGNGGQGKASCSQLPYPALTLNGLPGGTYKWQVRENVNGAVSGWGQYNGGNAAFTINGADIKVAPASLNFNNQLVGVASQFQALTVTSTGMGALNISSITIAGPFSASGLNAPAVLQPGSSANINVSFKPVAVGNASGTLTISSDAPKQMTVITLAGVGVTATAQVSPASFDWGPVPLNVTSPAQVFTVSNAGTGALTVTSLTPSGPFTFTNLPMLPITLQPMGTFTFTGTFTPIQVGLATGTMAIASNDPKSPLILTVQGTGNSLGLNPLPNPLAFGDTIIPIKGQQGTTKVVNLVSNINQAITVSSISAPTNADFVIVNPPALPTTVQPMGTLPVTIAFNPTMHAVENATLTVTSDAPNSPATLLLNGKGVGPVISAMPATIDFKDINVASSGLQTVAVKNSGETALTVKSIMMSGANAAEFSSPTSFPMKIQPGATQNIAVLFSPAAMGQRTATMVMVNDDPVNPALSVKLQGNATVPKVSAMPNPADFGSILVGGVSQPVPITISNAGPGALTISALALGGADAASFTVVPPALPMVVAAGASRTLSPVFSPKAAGAATAKLTLMTDDPNNTNFDINLKGTGLAAMVQLDPASIDFGASLVGRPGSARTVSITNGGTAALTVSGLTVTGSQAAAFTFNGGPMLPKKLMAGEKVTVNVVYTASSAQMETARLVVATDDPMSPISNVALSGTGVTTILTASPTSMDFGMIRAPGVSASKTVTITNVGGSTLTMAEPAIMGASPLSFSFKSSVGGTMLMPGGTGTADVTFMPAVRGIASATLNFKTNDPNLPGVTVTLQGIGAAPKVMATPGTVDFGNVAVGSTSAEKTVTLSNTSNTAFKIMSVTSDNAAFTISGVDTASNIAPSGQTKFTVAFAPSATGSAKANIAIMLAGGTDAENTILATGNGKAAAAPDMGGGGTEESGCTMGSHGQRTTPAVFAFALLGLGLLLRRRRPQA